MVVEGLEKSGLPEAQALALRFVSLSLCLSGGLSVSIYYLDIQWKPLNVITDNVIIRLTLSE
jgi:hypothetical protein